MMASRRKGASSKPHETESVQLPWRARGKVWQVYSAPTTGTHARENLACAAKCTWLLSAHCYSGETGNKPDPFTGDMIVAHIYVVQTQEDGWEETVVHCTTKGQSFM